MEGYSKLQSSECSIEEGECTHGTSESGVLLAHTEKPWRQREKTSMKRSIAHPIIVACLVLITIQSILLVGLVSGRDRRWVSSNGLVLEKNVNRKIYEHSKYLSHNETEASEAWRSILAGHGVVAIDPEYAAQKNLPKTVQTLDGSGKLLYIVEAYHAIHCIQIIRSHFVALEQGKPGNWSRPHDMHCFDALRQYVMCNIDDTLLWTTGNRESGTGQVKKCNDWDALRDWAEERTANYFDVEPGMGIKHLNNYHAGDGLPVGSLS